MGGYYIKYYNVVQILLFATHICDNRQDSHYVQDLFPGPYVACLGRHGTPELGGELPRIHPDLQYVVKESKEWCKREWGHKQGDEAKLDHCLNK